MGQVCVKVSYVKEFPDLGQRIRQARISQSREEGKPLAVLAANAGISVPHWNRIENEKVRELPLTTLRAIEQSLGVDLGVKFDD